MSERTIEQKSDGKRGYFFIEERGKRFAEMVYVMSETKKMIIEHTEVDSSLEGQGVGTQLLEKLVEYARNKNIKVIPLCPFAKATFKKRAGLQDVLN